VVRYLGKALTKDVDCEKKADSDQRESEKASSEVADSALLVLGKLEEGDGQRPSASHR
jgi:hypothetical protein